MEAGSLETMDIVLTVACGAFVIGILVIIHEGGHYLASRAFGVRVSEFMVGLPGPKIGLKHGETEFGITAIPLGGYAKVCGMETGEIHENAKDVLSIVYERGAIELSEISRIANLEEDRAFEALEEMVEWGSVIAPRKGEAAEVYRTPAKSPSSKEIRQANRLCRPELAMSYSEGDPQSFENAESLFAREHAKTYRSLPFWKRSVILLAGIAANLLFAVVAFVVVYSVIGVDVPHPETGEMVHLALDPLRSIQMGFTMIGMTFAAVASLFNPETAAQTVSDSTSVIGIAVMSKDFLLAGIADGLFFMALISISLGVMNLLPIPPLDGGRFLIEGIQRIAKRDVPMKVMGAMSLIGMALFLCFFAFMLNQDIQRFVLGNM